MKTKVLFLLAITSLLSISTFAQRSVRIGYIDTEYILQNVPEYQNATSQLETKVDKWKKEIEKRLNDLDLKKKQLSSESVLLTPELIQERQEEIDIEENEILDYQQKRFGPNGDLMIQRQQLMQPIQDQIFTAVQEIAANKKYDFVFDKSADVVMLYSADRYDISDQVLRSINRTAKRTQAQNRKERRAAKEEAEHSQQCFRRNRMEQSLHKYSPEKVRGCERNKSVLASHTIERKINYRFWDCHQDIEICTK